MQYTCNVTKMAESIDRSKTGPHIIKGTNYIATIKAQAGCCNANWLAAVHLGFEESEGAMASIGSCPSVGITGYSLGGGLGDVSPIAGYAADIITEYEMVLADGSVVTASEDKNQDLFWANRGGGGGIGVITSLTFKVIQTPSPGAYTLFWDFTPAPDKRGEFWVRVQDFLYDHPESYRFGGTGETGNSTPPDYPHLYLMFLGPVEEGLDILTAAGLLDQDIMEPNLPPTYVDAKGDVVCTNDCPAPFPVSGLRRIMEKGTNGETQAVISCLLWLGPTNPHYVPQVTARSRDVCADLGVDESYCFCVQVGDDPCYANGLTHAACTAPQVVDAILEAASDPTSFLSRHGMDVNVQDVADTQWPLNANTGIGGGLLLPRMQDETIRKLSAMDERIKIANHLAHGASNLISVDAAAMLWRDNAFNTASSDQPSFFKILLHDEAYGGDAKKLNGYYAYIGGESMAHWEQVYFGSHVEKLKRIKAKHDPNGVFDKPMQLHGSNIDMAAEDQTSADENSMVETSPDDP